MIHDILKLLSSRLTRRWHSNPDMVGCDESNGSHQWSTAMIALHIEPDLSRTALLHCLTHDVGELIAGDLSYDFKCDNPGLADAHRAAEERARDTIVSGYDDLSRREGLICKVADWIAAYEMMVRHAPWLRFRDDDWRKRAVEAPEMLAELGDRYWIAAATLIDDLNAMARERDGRCL